MSTTTINTAPITVVTTLGPGTEQARAQLEKSLETSVRAITETLTSMYSKEQLSKNIINVLMNLSSVEQAAFVYSDVPIPTPALEFVDRGLHPDEHLLNTVQMLVECNDMTRGRREVIDRFRAAFLEEMQEKFPGLYERYVADAQHIERSKVTV